MSHFWQNTGHTVGKFLQFRHTIGVKLPHTAPNRVKIPLPMPNTGQFPAIKLSERANRLLHIHHQIHTLCDIVWTRRLRFTFEITGNRLTTLWFPLLLFSFCVLFEWVQCKSCIMQATYHPNLCFIISSLLVIRMISYGIIACYVWPLLHMFIMLI